jgi:hypothetical protein
MAEITVGDLNDESRSWTWPQGAREFVLRLSSAVLHLLATWTVLANLSPEAAGTYYKGAVIALGLSALLYKKYDFYLVPYIAGGFARNTGIPALKAATVLRGRLLIRSSIVCAVLLVVTADLDIFEPRLQPYLQTFLPFVLAIPFVSLAALSGSLLRAADRPGLSAAAAGAGNLVVAGVALLGADHASRELYSWAFLVGSLISAGLATWFAKHILKSAEALAPNAGCSAWSRVHGAVAVCTGSSLAHSIVLWGPPCLLAIFASATEFASFAAAVRSSQVVEILLPGLTFLGWARTSMVPWMQWKCADRSAFLTILGASVITSSVISVALLLAGPVLFGLYGEPYSHQLGLFAVMLGAQWMNGVGRPASRFLTQNWQPAKVRRILEVAAVGGMIVCGLGLAAYGAFATATALFVAWTLVNCLATLEALGQIGKSPARRHRVKLEDERIADINLAD